MLKAIKGGNVITAHGILENTTILYDKKITDLHKDPTPLPVGTEVFDATGLYVCPGFISMHIHGCMGSDVEDATVESLYTIGKHLYSTGVTAWCPTLCTVEKERLDKVCDAIRAVKKRKDCADIIGLYLEGIFLSEKKKGAHKTEWLSAPDADLVLRHKDVIKVCICAPELDGSTEFIKKLTENGIIVAVGHTDCDYTSADNAFRSGAKVTTHLFNAMTPFSHREPGVIGAALNDFNVYSELICDNFHVHPSLYNFVWRNKPRGTILITDSIRPAGMPDGEYIQGGLHVTKKGIECRLDDGTIAGSMLDLNKGVYNVLQNSDIPLYEVVNCVTFNPARLLGLKKQGSIAVGNKAVFTIVDEDFNVIKVIK